MYFNGKPPFHKKKNYLMNLLESFQPSIDFFSFLIIFFSKLQISRLVQIESICRRQNKCNLTPEILFGMGRKHCGKRRKCWLPAFSPFPTIFSKGFFSGSFKVRIVW